MIIISINENAGKILGITWKDHVTNMEVLSRIGQRRLQDILAERRLQTAGQIIRMPPGRPANHAMSWTPRGSGRQRRLGGPHLKRTWWTKEFIGILEQRNGCGYKHEQMANSCCPLSCQGREDPNC